MNLTEPILPAPSQRPLRAVTLLELLVAVSLTLFIVAALYQMFARTQKVMRGSMVQGDMTENSRVAIDLLHRELESMIPGGTAFNPNPSGTNLYLDALSYASNAIAFSGYPAALDDICFLTFNPSANATPANWTLIGYHVGNPNNPLAPCNGVGTLYRFQSVHRSAGAAMTNKTYTFTNSNNSITTNLGMYYYIHPPFVPPSPPPDLPYLLALSNSFARVADGVVYFKAKVFTNGVPLNFSPIIMTGNVMPNLVDLEVGFLDAPTYGQAGGLPPAAVSNYLSGQGSHVQFFRTAIQIRSTPQ